MAPLSLPAQNLVANASFEAGVGSPANWVFNNALFCRWDSFGRTGDRCVTVTNNTVNCNGMQWRSAAFPVQPGKPYLVNLWAVSSNAAEVARVQVGLGTTGNSGLNDRYVFPPSDWRAFPYVALAPRNQSSLILRLISCAGVGAVSFDDVEVRPVESAHALDSGAMLGVGESVSPGKYRFAPNLRDFGLGYFGGNFSRAAYDCTAYFSTFFTYSLTPGTQLSFCHDYGGRTFTNGVMQVAGYPASIGTVEFEFSADATNWISGATFNPVNFSTYTNIVNIPASLLPTAKLFTRVRVVSGSYYVTSYTFEADVPDNTATASGSSLLFAQRVAPQGVAMVGTTNEATALLLTLANTNAAPRTYAFSWSVTGPAGTRAWMHTNIVDTATTNEFLLPFAGMGWGENTLSVQIVELESATTNFSGEAIFRDHVIHDSSFGALLPGNAGASVWWCDGTYKVGRQRALPAVSAPHVAISAARNEYEPFQVVVRPDLTLSNATIGISPFTALDTNNSATISATNAEFAIVDYVPVVQPTDTTSMPGEYPDPLLPWTAPVNFGLGSNQPVWVTVYVPRDTPAGEYAATLTIQAEAQALEVPVRLRVFDFTLSEVNHTKVSINCNVDDYWHAATNSSQRPAIYDLYMQNFRKHRVTPLKPHNYAPLTWQQVIETNGISYQFNFTNFDAAIERYIGEFGFNTLRLDSEILPNSLSGEPRFTPAYRELYKRFIAPVMAHLREKGWLRDAYCFWIDEPSATLVTTTAVPGMQTLGEAAPGLRRFVTREPVPELLGLIDTWCPYAPWLVPATVPARRAYGEQFWWYVSGGPGHPFTMYFTDYPASHPRLRFWQGEKFDFEGEVYWNTTWWLGALHAPINPWTNTMTRLFDGSAHGNGNGVLLYPPTRTPPASVNVAPPINSLRWEIIRDGIEDREYFWLLKQLLARREPVLGSDHPAVLQAKAARAGALGHILSRTYYDTDPQRMMAGRLAVAEAIEALDDGAPLITREPLSQAARAGSNVVLRAEAVGWPAPAYQWQHEGTNVPDATTAWLSLTNFGAEHLGAWQLVASNQFGVATSGIANLAGYWVPTPQIISSSAGDVRRIGDRTVLEVTAVSALPMTYYWYLNGVLLEGVTNNAWAINNLTTAHGGYYSVIASNAAGVATSAPIPLALPPVLVMQPGSQSVVAGDTLNMVTAVQGVAPFSYQWLHNGAPLIPPNNAAALIVTNVQAEHAGSYQVVISNAAGAITSAVVSVIVLLPPRIVVPPTNQTVFASHRAGFGVLGTGTAPLAYQWYFNLTNVLVDATNPVFVLTNVQAADAGDYTVVLSNAWGMMTSGVATLTVLTPSQLIEPPILTVVEGDTATFTAVNTISGPAAYSWYFNSTTFLPNGNSSLLVLTNVQATQAGNYHVVIGTANGDITSAAAILSVLVPPRIVEPPTNVSAIAGHDLPLRVVGSGTAPLAYQWYFNVTNSLPDATNDVLWITNVSTAAAGDYSVVLTNVVGAVTSPVATVTVLVPPSIIESPGNATVSVGADAQFQVTASGTEPLGYQWYFNDLTALAGATLPQFGLTNIQAGQAGSYVVLVSNPAGSVTSAPAWLMVFPNYTNEPPEFSGHWAGPAIGFELRLPVDNRVRTVLVSSNLAEWSTQFLVAPTGLPQVLTDSTATNLPHQFYQLRAN